MTREEMLEKFKCEPGTAVLHVKIKADHKSGKGLQLEIGCGVEKSGADTRKVRTFIASVIADKLSDLVKDAVHDNKLVGEMIKDATLDMLGGLVQKEKKADGEEAGDGV